jgi:hypothetical protein
MRNPRVIDVDDDDDFHSEDHGILADWGVVSNQDHSFSNTGVLILPGSVQARQANGSQAYSANLSIPGSDSIPTDIDSIVQEDDSRGRRINIIGGDSIGRSTSNGSSRLWENEEASILLRSQEELRTMNRRGSILAVLLVLVSVTSTSYLIWDRHTWKSSAVQLEQQIRHIQIALNETKLSALPTPTPKLEIPSLPWDVCSTGTPEEANTLVNNCWMKAKANVQLGDCAEQARQSVQKRAKEFGEKAFQAQEDFVAKAQQSVLKAQKVLTTRAQEALEKVDEYKTAWSLESKRKSGDGTRSASQEKSKDKEQVVVSKQASSDWRKVAATAVTGVVAVSLATVSLEIKMMVVQKFCGAKVVNVLRHIPVFDTITWASWRSS